LADRDDASDDPGTARDRRARGRDYFSHRSDFFRDGFWQIFCELKLASPSRALADDRFDRWLERTWMLQQLPWSLLLWILGGVRWVISRGGRS
jgi:hypothetical protein